MTHPYFVAKAAEVFIKAGGDPAVSGALAEWAETHRTDTSVDGVIVTRSGEILAETWHDRDPRGAGAYYVADRHRYRFTRGNELGLALADLRCQTGEPVIHVKHGDVCCGAARFIRPEALTYTAELLSRP